jgi:pyruvate dehydrogenase E1 component alpha subunit
LNVAKEKLTEMYRQMYLIRTFEYKVNDLYAQTKIFGALHSYAGEEAVAVGACAALQGDDYVVSSHRGHGHFLAKGGDVKSIMAELFGKNTGVCRAKGGSMHVADVSVGMLGASGIVGGGIPIATGAALSAKYKGTNQVVACFFGDGATNQGTFHESLNLASIWDLPVIYVCENNQYAEATHFTKAMRVKNIADRAIAYAMPGVVVDGMDVVAVYQEATKAVERAREGKGPTLLECVTYRFEGHEVGDPHHAYRSKNEIDVWRARCPIRQLKSMLMNNAISTEKEIETIEQTVKEQIEEAVRFAEESSTPEPKSALRDVFVSPYY